MANKEIEKSIAIIKNSIREILITRYEKSLEKEDPELYILHYSDHPEAKNWVVSREQFEQGELLTPLECIKYALQNKIELFDSNDNYFWLEKNTLTGEDELVSAKHKYELPISLIEMSTYFVDEFFKNGYDKAKHQTSEQYYEIKELYNEILKELGL